MILRLVDLVFNFIILLVFARVILSWLPVDRYHPAVMWVERVTEPMLRPFRVLLRTPAGGLDLAPMVFLIVLFILKEIVMRALAIGPRI